MQLSMTKHAEFRRKQADLSYEDIAITIRDAEVSYAGTDKNDGRAYQRGDLAVVAEEIGEDDFHVITILPRTNEDYVRPEKENTHS